MGASPDDSGAGERSVEIGDRSLSGELDEALDPWVRCEGLFDQCRVSEDREGERISIKGPQRLQSVFGLERSEPFCKAERMLSIETKEHGLNLCRGEQRGGLKLEGARVDQVAPSEL